MKEQQDKARSTINAQPDRLVPRHRALMRRLVAGMRLKDACEDIGFCLSRASVIVNSPMFQEEMRKMEQEVNHQFAQAEGNRAVDITKSLLSDSSEIAARTLRGALDDASATVRISAAKDILDRTGYAKEDKLKAKVLVEPSQSLIDVLKRIGEEPNGTDVIGTDREG